MFIGKTYVFRCILIICCGVSFSAFAASLSGNLYPWHTLSFTFDGPETSENYPSTFLNNRLTVTFTHKDIEYTVPGYFAADGNAGRSHATAGNKWRVNFTPDRVGKWHYSAKFVQGNNVAITNKQGKTFPLSDAEGTFQINGNSDKLASIDFRQHGRLEYVNKHYQQFAQSKKYFLKGGLGSPENLLAFNGFDGTWDAQKRPEFPSLGDDQLHAFEPHRKHWTTKDPYWLNEKGIDNKGLIGLVNYMAEQGLNSFYLMPLTYQGDGGDIWPWTSPDNHTSFDVSKLAQWDRVFSHMQQKGIHIHMLVTETENENIFEQISGGTFSDSRKLYYRELIARFGHHLALSWNLGEENGWTDDKGQEIGKGNTDEQRKMFMAYIAKLDPYHHPIKIHEIDSVKIYPQLVGDENFAGPSLQRHDNYNAIVQQHVAMSTQSIRPWLVSMDEPLGWEFGLRPDADDPAHDKARIDVLWGTYMAGGSGVEWYFGWQNNSATSDLSSEDMLVREAMWQQTKIAREFFENNLPFAEMSAANNLVSGEDDYVFAKTDAVYLVYLKKGGQVNLDLTHSKGKFDVKWFDPRNGGELQTAQVTSVVAGKVVALGSAPNHTNKDWAVLVTKTTP